MAAWVNVLELQGLLAAASAIVRERFIAWMLRVVENAHDGSVNTTMLRETRGHEAGAKREMRRYGEEEEDGVTQRQVIARCTAQVPADVMTITK
jgi:hypothetical protein